MTRLRIEDRNQDSGASHLPSMSNYAVDQFADHGYVVIPGVLPRELIEMLHQAFTEIPMRESQSSHGQRRQANERVLVSDERFMKALLAPKLIDGIRHILGEDFQLLDYEAVEWAPHSGKERDWHADLHFWSAEVLTANAAIYLRDMTDENGPLVVVPESHKRRREPAAEDNLRPYPDEMKVYVKAGDAVIFNTLLWHSGSRNNSEFPRRVIFPYFGHYWIKRMDEFYKEPLPQNILKSIDPLVRQLFGLELSFTKSIHGETYRKGIETWE